MCSQKITKTTLKRQQQRLALIDAAERAITEKGLTGFKARELADEIGIGLGQIYNLVTDLDELLFCVNSKTLIHIENEVEAYVQKKQPKTAQDMLIVIAQSYYHFARDHYHLWRTLFDHQLTSDKPMPQWVTNERLRLFKIIDKPLATLMKGRDIKEISLFSQMLFSSIHGSISLTLNRRNVGVPADLLDTQIEIFIKTICSGLEKSNESK